METCVTLGMLEAKQARRLKARVLDYYNHNLDTAPEDYGRIISTRTYQDRLDTLEHVRDAGIAVCCGGIVGIGETREDRIGLIANAGESSRASRKRTINMLMQVEGNRLRTPARIDPIEFVRMIGGGAHHHAAVMVRLSAGRENMTDEGAGAVLPRRREFDLLWREAADTPNPGATRDRALFDKLGMTAMDGSSAEMRS